MRNSKKSDKRERALRLYLGHLKKYAALCTNTTSDILQYHARFASLMAQRIDDASKSYNNLKYDDSETTRLANDISKASRLLSINVTNMKDNLISLVATLEDVQVAVKKDRLLAERIRRWLDYLFKATDSTLAIVHPPTSAALPSAGPKRDKFEFFVSPLREAAAKFCTAGTGAYNPSAARTEVINSALDTEPHEREESESLDPVILFLKDIAPREVQNAQKKLSQFDEAGHIMELERQMRAGQRVILYGPGLASVVKAWRDVAEQYGPLAIDL